MLLRMLLVGFCAGSDLHVLLRKDADDSCCDFVVYDSLVVLANDVDAEFLRGRGGKKAEVRKGVKAEWSKKTYDDVIAFHLVRL